MNGLSLFVSLFALLAKQFCDVVGVVVPPTAPPTRGGEDAMLIGLSPSELSFRKPPKESHEH